MALNIQKNVHMIVVPLVCLHSVAIQRETTDAALVPTTDKSYLLVVWSPSRQTKTTASIPAKCAQGLLGLSHLF